MEDKDQLIKRNYFGAIFEIFDEVLRKAKKEHSSVKLSALQEVVGRFADISESNYTGPAKRQRLVEAIRSRLNSDTSIDHDDI